MIPVYRPHIGEAEKRYVVEAIESTWISSKGPFIERFERGFAGFLGSEHGVGTCNGTVSLHLILAAMGIGPGDEVIVPTFTYVASVNAITYTGATPVFVDSEPLYWNLDPNLLEERITPRTKAIMVVHLYGNPAEMQPIMTIAERHGIPVIEDAAEAHGALCDGRKVGTFGLASSFSFFGNKIITTGEGGMVITNDAPLAQTCRHLKGQGVSSVRTYWHDVVGFNYRMTNICAAIGVAQLERIDAVLSAKRRIAERYAAGLSRVKGVTTHSEAPWATNAWWMVSIIVDPAERDPLMAHLSRMGIETRPFFYPAHILPMYVTTERFPVAERIAASGINLPSFPDLREDEIDEVCAAIEAFGSDGGR